MRKFLIGAFLSILVCSCTKTNKDVIYVGAQYNIVKLNDTVFVCMPKQPNNKPFVINLNKTDLNNVITEGEE